MLIPQIIMPEQDQNVPLCDIKSPSLEDSGLFTSYQQSLAIHKRFPEFKTAFSWYVQAATVRSDQRVGDDIRIAVTPDKKKTYIVRESGSISLGWNWASCLTLKKVPAFTLQELLMIGKKIDEHEFSDLPEDVCKWAEIFCQGLNIEIQAPEAE